MSTNIAASNVHALVRMAKDTRGDGHVWRPGQNLAEGRNAHYSNTEEEMRTALDGDHNWIEGDLRVDDDGGLVMAHDAKDEGAGLSLDQWLEVGKAGERGLKVDVKEAEGVPALVDKLVASGIPSERLMVNVGNGMSVEEVRKIRERLPDAWIAITPSDDGGRYSASSLERAIELGAAAGGNVSYPIRWDLASDDVVQTLKRNGVGKVSIWTNQVEGTPNDTEAETRRLRERGVDGMIDLGPPQSNVEKAQTVGKDLYQDARRGVKIGGQVAARVTDTAVDGVKTLVGAPGKIVGKVGDLFGD